MCGQSYQTSTNYLSAPIDVYSDWIDACDAVAKEAAGAASGGRTGGGSAAARRPAARNEEEDEDEDGKLEGDFIEEDEGDGEAEYGDE